MDNFGISHSCILLNSGARSNITCFCVNEGFSPNSIPRREVKKIDTLIINDKKNGYILKMNAKLTQLLKEVAQKRGITLDDLKNSVDEHEIVYREREYPNLSNLILAKEIDIDALNAIVKNLTLVSYDKIKLKVFLSNPNFAKNAIQSLITGFPRDDTFAAERIDNFIETLMNSQLSEGKKGIQKAYAALFCSLFLTAVFPERFVDFRQSKWVNLARALGYETPSPVHSYGQMIVWAGKFAQEIAKRPVFQKYWQTEHPLWAVAGLCWNLRNDVNNKPISGEDDMADTECDERIHTLLKKKGQIIFYGPPGTGKTYLARQIIHHQKQHYTLAETSLLDQRVFSLTIWPPRDGEVFELKPKDTFVYQWNEKRNWQRPYEDLQEGDILLAYHPNPFKQYRAILRCLEKERDSIRLEFVKSWNGPTFKEMKEDPILKDTLMMRVTMTFSLKKLDEVELERIQALSPELTNKALGFTETLIHESVSMGEFVTFHPSFGYEEFIEGLRPESDEEGNLYYNVQDGIFKRFARQACNVLLQEAKTGKRWMPGGGPPPLNEEERENIRKIAGNVPFYLIIDEINRGDISRIFGDLITLIEADKRYAAENEIITRLPYSKQSFAVPPNLYLVGTMNTADKSIALIDIALRRRFGFIELMPDYDLLATLFEDVPDDVRPITDLSLSLLQNINSRILSMYDRDHQIGHSYLVHLKESRSRDEAIETLRFAWYYEIIPLLQEYFFDSPKKLKEIIGDRFVSIDGEYGFTFTPELSGEQFIDALEIVASNGTGITNGISDEDGNII